MKLTGTSAVVTGGGNGIGKAICLALAQENVNVAVLDIEEDAANAVAEEISKLGVASFGVHADVTNEESLVSVADKAWEAFGSVELLVNNAGVSPTMGPTHLASADDLNWVLSVNVLGTFLGLRVFLPRFIESQKPCHVVNTASEHALGVPHIGNGLYTASKHAILGLSDVLRQEMPEHVGMSVLCPGIVGSTLWKATERRQEKFGGPEEANAAAASVMNQMGMSAEDVAKCVVSGIENENFYILSHPHVVQFAQERWTEIEASFKEQAPRVDGDEKYNLKPLLEALSKTWNV